MKKKAAILLLASAGVLWGDTPSVMPGGFAIPRPNPSFVFPRDHGSHPEFRTEWWYVTGHLDAANGRRFGFQVTFFRQASAAHEQLFLAHAALLDADHQRFISEERLNREGWDAESSRTTLDVHNGNWSLGLNGGLHLAASIRTEAKIRLTMKVAKPLVVFGKDGVSIKGRSPEASSHYLTFPRLACEGTVNAGDGDTPVTGMAWMDHEFSSSQLDQEQSGWDWACLQLNEGREIMVYRMRLRNGSADPAGTTLARISKDGVVHSVDTAGFTWTPGRTWKSPKTGAVYPVEAVIRGGGEEYRLRPLIDAQELDGAVSGLPYWEGACDVLDGGGKVVGRAFLELAGYAGDLAKHLGPEGR